MKKEFHFVMKRESLVKLENLAKRLKKSVSSTIVDIFYNMSAYLEKKELSFKEESGKYGFLGNDDEARSHVHVYLPKDMHRKMKQVHNELDYFSMAQIMREIIEVYLTGCKIGIQRYKRRLSRTNKRWERMKKMFVKMKKRIVRHLSSNLSSFPLFSVTYDNFYSPCAVKLLR
jgi:uncharacterized Fe-S radical SAM superfamily protein PflX